MSFLKKVKQSHFNILYATFLLYCTLQPFQCGFFSAFQRTSQMADGLTTNLSLKSYGHFTEGQSQACFVRLTRRPPVPSSKYAFQPRCCLGSTSREFRSPSIAFGPGSIRCCIQYSTRGSHCRSASGASSAYRYSHRLCTASSSFRDLQGVAAARVRLALYAPPKRLSQPQLRRV